MPTWGDTLQELKASADQNGGNPDFDTIRRRYLSELHALTGRDTVLYSSDFLSGDSGADTSIQLSDMRGLMETFRGLNTGKLDLIIHSPGGDATATASLVRYMRQQFSDVRVFVPLAAMSAATMWSLAADVIVMGKHSQLGPIDPQVIGPRGAIPARAIIKQFERASIECAADVSKLSAWVPLLQQYPPGLLEICEDAEAMAKRLVREWLREYMFRADPKATNKARRVSDYFADYSKHKSHNLGIDRDQATAKGVKVENLEDDPKLQDAVLSVHHLALHTFSGPCVKIIENHLGKGVYQLSQAVPFPIVPGPPTQVPLAPGGMPGVPPHLVPAPGQ